MTHKCMTSDRVASFFKDFDSMIQIGRRRNREILHWAKGSNRTNDDLKGGKDKKFLKNYVLDKQVEIYSPLRQEVSTTRSKSLT